MAKEVKTEPPQEQHHRPGIESEMTPLPEAEDHHYKASGKLDEGRSDHGSRLEHR